MEHEIFSSYINVAALIAAGVLIGILIGYAFARFGRVSGEGGYSAREQARFDELQGEYDDYRDRVEAHFRETSVVFQQTTEQYRTLYRQIASGAIELCDPEAVRPILESTSSTARVTQELSSVTGAAAHKGDDDNVDASLGNALAEMRAEMNELDQAINDLRKDVLDPKRTASENESRNQPAVTAATTAAGKTASWQALADHSPANDSKETPVADLDAMRRRNNSRQAAQSSARPSAEPSAERATVAQTPVYEPDVRSAGSGLTARSSLLFDTDDAIEPELIASDAQTTGGSNSTAANPLFKNTERLDHIADTLRRDDNADAATLIPNPRRDSGYNDTIDFKLDKNDAARLQR